MKLYPNTSPVRSQTFLTSLFHKLLKSLLLDQIQIQKQLWKPYTADYTDSQKALSNKLIVWLKNKPDQMVIDCFKKFEKLADFADSSSLF